MISYRTNQPAFVLGINVQIKTGHAGNSIGDLNVVMMVDIIMSVIKLGVGQHILYKKFDISSLSWAIVYVLL